MDSFHSACRMHVSVINFHNAPVSSTAKAQDAACVAESHPATAVETALFLNKAALATYCVSSSLNTVFVLCVSTESFRFAVMDSLC